jgi:hypothetical protein
MLNISHITSSSFLEWMLALYGYLKAWQIKLFTLSNKILHLQNCVMNTVLA